MVRAHRAHAAGLGAFRHDGEIQGRCMGRCGGDAGEIWAHRAHAARLGALLHDGEGVALALAAVMPDGAPGQGRCGEM